MTPADDSQPPETRLPPQPTQRVAPAGGVVKPSDREASDLAAGPGHERYRQRMRRKKAHVDTGIARATIERGVAVVNTDAGKGKSSSAFETRARALGHGFRCGAVQFIKGRRDTGEGLFFGRAGGDLLDWRVMGADFTWETRDRHRDIAAAVVSVSQRQGDPPNPQQSKSRMDVSRLPYTRQPGGRYALAKPRQRSSPQSG